MVYHGRCMHMVLLAQLYQRARHHVSAVTVVAASSTTVRTQRFPSSPGWTVVPQLTMMPYRSRYKASW